MKTAALNSFVMALPLALAFVLAFVLAAAPARAAAQEAPSVAPRLVDRSGEVQLTPETEAEIADLQERREDAEFRSRAFGALTIGGTTLVVAGVVAMAVVGAIGGSPSCMDDCVAPIEDFAPGVTLMLTGIVAVLVGGLLWGDADANARELGERIDLLRQGPVPSITVGPDSARVDLSASF